MGEALHVAALVPAGVGLCCLAATPGPRGRPAELLASLVMIAAMADLAFGARLVPAVVWAAALVICSLALAGVARVRRRGAATINGRTHTAIGGLVAVPLVILMDAGATATGGAHAHGVGSGMLLLPAAGYVVWSAILAARRHGSPPGSRLQHAAMGLSILLMTLGAALGHA